jgi:DUF971 family protein
MTDPQAWPLELRLHKDRKTLTVAFEGGANDMVPFHLVRGPGPRGPVDKWRMICATR